MKYVKSTTTKPLNQNKMKTLIAIFLVLKSVSNGIKLLNQKNMGAKAVELTMLIVHLVFGIYLFNL